MPTVEVVEDDSGGATASRLLARVRESGRGILAVHEETGAGCWLGRYHLDVDAPGAVRRPTGGRIVRRGDGCFGVRLALPHRSRLESTEPDALAPAQAMNRCVRGVLGGLERLGVDAVYPGRDVVTVDRRPVGWLGLTEAVDGAALFEAGIDLRTLEGVAALERRASAVRAAILDGYRARLALDLEAVAAASLPTVEEPDLQWRLPAHVDRVGRVTTMLGFLRADVLLDAQRHVAACRLSGDVIAPETTMRELEEAVLGTLTLRGLIESAVREVMTRPGRWVLGIDAPTHVGDAVMQAVGT